MSDYDNPRPTAGTPYSDPCAVKDMSITLGKLMEDSGGVSTYNGKSLMTLTEAIDKFGFGVAPFTFADGGTLSSFNFLVSNSPVDNFFYKYVGTGTAPLVIPPFFDPSASADWDEFIATDAKFITSANVTVSGIKNLVVPTVTGQSFSVTGFYAGTSVGGGNFVYDASRDKADHTGGSVIAPEAIAAWDGTQADLAALLNWTGTGTGCWVRTIENHTASIGSFGSSSYTIPALQEYTLDGMGESISNPMTIFAEYPASPVSVRDERITAIGTAVGGAAGSVNYYGAIRLTRNGDTISNCFYDGNNKGTFSAYNPAAVNEWIQPFVFGGNYQKMIGNTILNNCGHAIENTSSAEKGLISALNYAERHNGLGVTNVVGYISIGNLSSTTSDSAITQHSCTFAAVVGNVAHSGVAASGADISGGNNVNVTANTFANNQFSGIWALKSPNTGELLNNALISNNVLSNNTKYAGATIGQGELTLGDYNNQMEYQGKAWVANGNLIDVSSGTNYSLAAWVHKFVSAPSVSYNYITGVDKPNDAIQILDKGAEYAAYVGNIGRTSSTTGDYVYSTLYLESKVAGRGATYSGNEGFRIDPESIVMPEVMHDSDGRWVYSCVVKPNVSSVGFVRLKYDGGFTTFTAKLTVTSKDGGMLEKLIVLNGAQGVATTILANLDVHAFGGAIGITINTTSTDYTDIELGAHSSEYGIKLEVISPSSDRNHILMFY